MRDIQLPESMKYVTGPAVETSNPAYRLVALDAPLVAFGLGLIILAAGPATSDSTPYCGGAPILKFVATAIDRRAPLEAMPG